MEGGELDEPAAQGADGVPGDDSLGMDPEAFRRLGYRIVDEVVTHYATSRARPAVRTVGREDLLNALGGPVPLDPGSPDEALSTLVGVALDAMQHGDHPRYFARVPGPSSFAGVLGDWLGSGFNAIAASWAGGSGTTTVEIVVLEWLRTLLGLPEGTEGVFTSGGSLANLQALLVAGAQHRPAVTYMSDQAHASLAKGLRSIGAAPEMIRILPSDDRFRLSVDSLARAISEDRRAGREPRVVVASAGTTNTGATDPLGPIAEICRSQDLWLHVDGAYGASAALTESGRRAIGDLGLADSLAVDPHKWLFQPYDAGCLLVRRPGLLEAAFNLDSEYLTSAHGEDVDLRDRTLELTRRARALKLWLTFRVHGAAEISRAIERGIRLAELAEDELRRDDFWSVVTPAQLGVVTFAPRRSSRSNVEIAELASEDGHAALTCTRLRDRDVLRLCTINPRTSDDDVRSTLARLKSLAGAD
jgi:glutamate/tyrosine decarboxylase-like PLP-dependent enzyme